MQIDLIIAALRTRCAATFGDNVAGAAEFKGLDEATALPLPCAFVIPMDDNPDDDTSANSVRQNLRDTFAVVVCVSNAADPRGQGSATSMHALRALLWSALLGWQPSDTYGPIQYAGGTLLAMDRARLWYQFEFTASMTIDASDGYQATALAALPHFDGASVSIDMLANGAPDGQTDVLLTIPKTGNLPS